jgi:hypothetical protein
MVLKTKTYKIVSLFGFILGLAVFAQQPAYASDWNGFQLTKNERQLYRAVGTDFGCSVPTRRGVEVRVTSNRAVRRAQQLKKSKVRVDGKRIVGVRVVPRSQSLVNVLSAWLSVETTRTHPGGYGAVVSVGSPPLPVKKNRCRTVQIALIGWPDHEVSQAQLLWANDMVKSFPQNVELTIVRADSEPFQAL